jgi:hypothetical protein
MLKTLIDYLKYVFREENHLNVVLATFHLGTA